MLKSLLKFTQVIVNKDECTVTAMINTKKLSEDSIVHCSKFPMRDKQVSYTVAKDIVENRPVFIGIAKLKDGDNSDLDTATKIARTKLERQLNKYCIQVAVKTAIDLYDYSKAFFRAALKCDNDAARCTGHIIDLQLPKDHPPVDIDTSESRSMSAKKFLQNSWDPYVDFIKAVEDDRANNRAHKHCLKQDKKSKAK